MYTEKKREILLKPTGIKLSLLHEIPSVGPVQCIRHTFMHHYTGLLGKTGLLFHRRSLDSPVVVE